MVIKILKLINLFALLLSIAWAVTKPDWEPKITCLTLVATIISLEFVEERKRARNPDVHLFNEFLQALPSGGDMEYVRTQDMAGLIDTTHLK